MDTSTAVETERQPHPATPAHQQCCPCVPSEPAGGAPVFQGTCVMKTFTVGSFYRAVSGIPGNGREQARLPSTPRKGRARSVRYTHALLSVSCKRNSAHCESIKSALKPVLPFPTRRGAFNYWLVENEHFNYVIFDLLTEEHILSCLMFKQEIKTITRVPPTLSQRHHPAHEGPERFGRQPLCERRAHPEAAGPPRVRRMPVPVLARPCRSGLFFRSSEGSDSHVFGHN